MTSGIEPAGINGEDAARELDKAADVLEQVERYLLRMAEMNAALHLADKVLPSPLTVRVQVAIANAHQSAQRFREIQ